MAPTTYLFRHWTHHRAGTTYRKRTEDSLPTGSEISEVLLQLPELQNIAGKCALILRGNGGRELIGDSLTARGAEVTFVNVINDAQSITMVQKKRCAGNPAR